MIHVYKGDGKGKTSAALGLALRAAGRNKRVLFVSFLKDGNSGEVLMEDSLKNISFCCCQKTVCGFFWELSEGERLKLKTETQKGLFYAQTLAAKKACDVIVLDELSGCITNGLLREEDVLFFLNTYKDTIELVLTGRTFPESVLGIADYISDIRAEKHPYDKGILPREGIEY